jgi:hypothetical protein
MSQTSFERLLAPLELSFPIPTQEALRLELSDRQLILLALSGLDALFEAQQGYASSSEPVASQASVTSSLATISAATPYGRMVEVTNNGEDSVMILTGGTPQWVNEESAPFPFGIELRPGDYWQTPRPIKSAVKAIAKDGEQAVLTVINYKV